MFSKENLTKAAGTFVVTILALVAYNKVVAPMLTKKPASAVKA